MESELFSALLKEVNPEDYGSNIVDAFEELRRIFGADEVKAFHWNEDYIAASFSVSVSKPSRGTVNGIDIRDKEPILLLFSKKLYPHKCPRVRSDRIGFPVKNVPHISPGYRGQAPSICIHRGNYDDWFAEHTLQDIIVRIKRWFRDAARNKLIPEGDLYEFTRMDNATGVAIYDSAILIDYIHKYWDENDGRAGYAFLWMEILSEESYEKKDNKYAVRVEQVIHGSLLEKVRDVFLSMNQLREEMKIKTIQLIGILVFPSRENPSNQYISNQPQKLEEILEIAHELGLPVQEALEEYNIRELKILKGVPLLTTILRPRNIIGLDTNIEFLHHVLCAFDEHDVKDGIWQRETPTFILGHRMPLTKRLAREISTTQTLENGDLVIIGCGAVGSKIALSLARSGETDLCLVDGDELSPHNMVRHALLADSVGTNKAKALKAVIEEIYRSDRANISIDIFTDEIQEIVHSSNAFKLTQSKAIIDCSASSNVLNFFTNKQMLEMPPVIRCEITDKGKVGVCYSEGKHRNPRVDDLQAILFDLSLDNPRISSWLIDHKLESEGMTGAALQDIDIGMSCSSSTLKLADDVISYHSATFTMGLRKVLNSNNDVGNIRVSYYDEKDEISGCIFEFEVRKFLVFNSGEDTNSWEVRVSDNAVNFMSEQLRRAIPAETGGILVGYLQPKRKIIYVTRALNAPPDSQASPYAFIRGISDSPEIIDEIGRLSGGLLGYVGEWHTHPFGSSRLSSRDITSAQMIKATLDKVGLPTHIIVVSRQAIASYII